MRKLHWSMILLVFLIPAVIFSQQLSPTVVSASGGFYSNSSGMLSFTTGEMSSVETFTHPLVILTQGFQQPWDINTNVSDEHSSDISFEIYPNPSGGHFNLISKSETDHQITVTILDIMGVEIMRSEFLHQGIFNVESMDLSHSAQGIYLVSINVNKTYSSISEGNFIKKINIVK